MNDNKNNIKEYYLSIDDKLINNSCKDNNIKNLIMLSTNSDINIFNKRNNKHQLKRKKKILTECDNINNKALLDSSIMISNLAKLKIDNICVNKEKYIECYSND